LHSDNENCYAFFKVDEPIAIETVRKPFGKNGPIALPMAIGTVRATFGIKKVL
jgi:hypothetical protein